MVAKRIRKSLTKEIVQETIKDPQVSMREASRLLDVPHSSFVRLCKDYGIYTPRPRLTTNGEAALESKRVKSKKALETIIYSRDPRKVNHSRLKERILRHGFLENKCIACGNTGEWVGKPLTLQIDHIDGDSCNNHISNLRMLCANCHSQTPTYCRSIGTNKRADYTKLAKVIEEHKPETMPELLKLMGLSVARGNYKTVGRQITKQKIKTKIQRLCYGCATPIRRKGKTGLCVKCSSIDSRKVPRPNEKELAGLLGNLPMTKIGAKYGVSDNAVRKWLRSYGLPTLARDILEFKKEYK